jgi:hypothetical protein
MLHNLDFQSLYLELFVIESLSGRSRASLAENVLHALRTIGTSLASTRIEDPANTNNVLSDDLSKVEKERIAGLARQASQQQSWGSIIW